MTRLDPRAAFRPVDPGTLPTVGHTIIPFFATFHERTAWLRAAMHTRLESICIYYRRSTHSCTHMHTFVYSKHMDT